MFKYIFTFLFMILTSMIAFTFEPTELLANKSEVMNLEKNIPYVFGTWYAVDDEQAQIIEPERAAVINYLYSQTLSRTFVNKKTGMRVMLSLAYGKVQSDGKEVHKPEVCYPAQGFTIDQLSKVTLDVGHEPQHIRATQLIAKLGSRIEPVVYWTTLGTYSYNSRMQKKQLELNYALQNLIPDGLLFRVSMIDQNTIEANSILYQFINDLYSSISEQTFKKRLFGFQ